MKEKIQINRLHAFQSFVLGQYFLFHSTFLFSYANHLLNQQVCVYLFKVSSFLEIILLIACFALNRSYNDSNEHEKTLRK